MGDLFRRISQSIRNLTGREQTGSSERRRTPRLICSTPVIWEVGREQGTGQLREISAGGLKLWSDRAILAGKHIRIRPGEADDGGALTVDMAIGTVVYSRARGGRFEVGVELVNPERISGCAWVGQPSRQEARSPGVPEVLPTGEFPRLRLLKGRAVPPENGLLRAEFRGFCEEKNSKI
ncbi:MAG: PilZ domain-containing protein [Vulcanimicrobiota bacterium]